MKSRHGNMDLKPTFDTNFIVYVNEGIDYEHF